MTTPLVLAFMGTPEFSLPTLKALLAAGHRVAAVYAQPPRPAGRGHKLRLSPVHAFAETEGIAVRTPTTLRDPAAQAEFQALELDAAVVVAYGLILPKPILSAPRLGCVNVHASLLPRWRGAAPIQRAIMAGDDRTGVCAMMMEAGLDTGPTLLCAETPIGPEDTGGTVHDRLAALGAELIAPSLAGLADGTLRPRPQPEAGVTYAHKLLKADGRLDWSRPAAELDRIVRALSPVPRAWTRHGDVEIKVGAATVEDWTGEAPPGTVLDDALLVATGAGALRLTALQRPGKAMMPADAFLRGYALGRGERLHTDD